MDKRDLTVVKLGGSHAGTAHLNAWLEGLVTCGGRAVIVPGGGPFADAVRDAQVSMGFDDIAAHAMALLAMEQFGLALASGRLGFCTAASDDAIFATLDGGQVPVWAPSAMVLAADVPANWDVTSDSLSVWLARRIGAPRLLLVKHGAPSGPVQVGELAARNVVDPAFPLFLAASGVTAFIAGPDAHAAAVAAILSGQAPGVCIGLHHEGATGLHLPPWPRSERRAGVGP
jgi:dihydroneopterin aldolase